MNEIEMVELQVDIAEQFFNCMEAHGIYINAMSEFAIDIFYEQLKGFVKARRPQLSFLLMHAVAADEYCFEVKVSISKIHMDKLIHIRKIWESSSSYGNDLFYLIASCWEISPLPGLHNKPGCCDESIAPTLKEPDARLT